VHIPYHVKCCALNGVDGILQLYMGHHCTVGADYNGMVQITMLIVMQSHWMSYLLL